MRTLARNVSIALQIRIEKSQIIPEEINNGVTILNMHHNASIERCQMVKHTQTIRRQIADELFECV